MLKKRIHQCTAALLAAVTIGAAEAVTFSEVEVGNVTTTGFCLCWETSESSLPGLEMFSDAGGTQSLAGQVAIEFFPLGSDQRAVSSSVTIREEGRTLRDAIKSKNLVLVKVTGLEPGTDYYARPTEVDGSGSVLSSGDLQAVTTAQNASFVNEARQVLIDLSAVDTPGAPVQGAILKVTTPEARYPLLTVVGDGADSQKAYADVTQFLNLAGDRNLLPSGLTALTITWKGLPAYTGDFSGTELTYTDGPLVGASSDVIFAPMVDEDINYFVFFRKTPVVGLPQDILIAALDPVGATLVDYNRPAEVSASPQLLQGAGLTAPFVDGNLLEHTIVFGAVGAVDLTVSDPLGSSVTTYPVNVLPLTYENWRIYYFGDAVSVIGDPGSDPDMDDLDNAGEFSSLRNPLRRSSDVINVAKVPGGIRVWVDFNKFQNEYEVSFQTSLDLVTWMDSTIPPTLQVSLPEKNILEAVLPRSEFDDLDTGYVRAFFSPVSPP